MKPPFNYFYQHVKESFRFTITVAIISLDGKYGNFVKI